MVLLEQMANSCVLPRLTSAKLHRIVVCASTDVEVVQSSLRAWTTSCIGAFGRFFSAGLAAVCALFDWLSFALGIVGIWRFYIIYIGTTLVVKPRT